MVAIILEAFLELGYASTRQSMRNYFEINFGQRGEGDQGEVEDCARIISRQGKVPKTA